MTSNLTQDPEFKIRRKVSGLPQTKRKPLFDALSKLKVGDGIEVSAENYNKMYMGCRWACANVEQFKGWKVGSKRSENGYIIKRIA